MGTSSGVLPKLPGDAEYGEQVILTRRANWEPWSLSLDTQMFYTDNVALVPEGSLDDWYLRTGAVIQYSNRIGGDWFLDAALTNHLYLHDAFDEFDFHLLRAELGVLRRISWLQDTFLSLRYSWYRISEANLSDEAFQDHVVSIGAQKIWKISRGQQIFAGLNADFSLAPYPAPPGRHEFSGFIGYKLRLTEKFSMHSSYRGALYSYTQGDREDWNNVILLGCSYELTDWALLSAGASASWNRSSSNFFAYDNLISGAGIMLHIEF